MHFDYRTQSRCGLFPIGPLHEPLVFHQALDRFVEGKKPNHFFDMFFLDSAPTPVHHESIGSVGSGQARRDH
jgi:hypothetical protein